MRLILPNKPEERSVFATCFICSGARILDRSLWVVLGFLDEFWYIYILSGRSTISIHHSTTFKLQVKRKKELKPYSYISRPNLTMVDCTLCMGMLHKRYLVQNWLLNCYDHKKSLLYFEIFWNYFGIQHLAMAEKKLILEITNCNYWWEEGEARRHL